MTDIHQFLDSDYLDTPLVTTAFGPLEGSKHHNGRHYGFRAAIPGHWIRRIP